MKTHISRCQALPLQNITVIRKSDFLSNCLENQLLGRDGSRLDTKKPFEEKSYLRKMVLLVIQIQQGLIYLYSSYVHGNMN
jgi:hypothetical protein